MDLITHSWSNTKSPKDVFIGVHGAESHSSWFNGIANKFNEYNCDFISYDRSGSGKSPLTYQGLRYEIEILRKLVSALKKKYDRVHILAISWGGLLSYNLPGCILNEICSIQLIAPGLFPKKKLSLFGICKVIVGLSNKRIKIPLPFQSNSFSKNRLIIEKIESDPHNKTARSARFYLDTFSMIINLKLRKRINHRKFFAYLPNEDEIISLSATKQKLRKQNINFNTMEGSHALILESPELLASKIYGSLDTQSHSTVSISYCVEELPFRFSFKHAHKKRTKNRSLFLRLKLGKHEGYGEALYRDYLVGESIKNAQNDLENFWPEKILSIPFYDLDKSIERLKDIYLESVKTTRLSTFSALDIAIYSLLSSIHNTSIEELISRQISSNPRHISTKLVATIPEIPRFLRFLLLNLYRSLGYNYIKIKVSNENINSVISFIKVAPPKLKFILDTNKSVASCDLLSLPSNIEFLEDPDLGDLNVGNYPSGYCKVLLDEYILSTQDAKKYQNIVPNSQLNVRLAKNGGITGAIALINHSFGKGIGYYQGSLVGESGLLAYFQSALYRACKPEYFECGFNNILLKKNPFIWHQPYNKEGLEKSLNNDLYSPTPRKYITQHIST